MMTKVPFFTLAVVLGTMFCAGVPLLHAEEAVGAGHEYDNIELDGPITAEEKMLPAVLELKSVSPLRTYDAEMFGLSYDFVDQDNIRMAAAKPGETYPVLLPDFQNAAAGVPFPLNRMWILKDNWKFAIGPVEERKEHKRASWDRGGRQITGPVELVKAVLAVDPKAKFDILVTIRDADAVKQAREIAEFMLGSAETEWGAKRIEYGLAAPVPVAVWELGNETDWARNPKIDAEEYVRLCKETMQAIRSVDPNARFAPHSATAPWNDISKSYWKEWNKTVIQELGADSAMLAFHPYYHGYPIDYIETYIKTIADEIKAGPNPDLKIFVSEHGLWPGGEPGSWNNSWYRTHALIGCLAVSEWFNRMLAHPEIGAMTMHAASSGPWGMFYPDPYSRKVYSTALADLFKLYAQIPFGSDVLPTAFSGEGTEFTGGKLTLSAVALRPGNGDDGNTLFLIITNRLPETSREITLKLGAYKPQTIHTLTSGSVLDQNTLIDRPVKTRTRKATEEEAHTLAVPPGSVTLVECVK